jgi:hypothetical protein
MESKRHILFPELECEYWKTQGTEINQCILGKIRQKCFYIANNLVVEIV